MKSRNFQRSESSLESDTPPVATGCRLCRRDNPKRRFSAESVNSDLVVKICRLIEDSHEEPSLKELAEAVGLSPSHFHRVFKASTGITAKQYAFADRTRRVRHTLSRGNSITEAIYDAGFGSSGRFYEKANRILGMTPSQYRSGGANEEIKYALGRTPLGAILIASSKKGVVSILCGDNPDELICDLRNHFSKARLVGGDRRYEALVTQTIGLIEAPRIGWNLPFDIRCTIFRQRVWQELQSFPVDDAVSCTDTVQPI